MNQTILKTSDKLILIVLIISALTCSFVLGKSVPDGILRGNSDFWFQGDVNRVVNNMVSRETNHNRAKVHPLFALSTYPVVTAVSGITNLPPLAVASGMIMFTAALWTALLFLIFRNGGLSQTSALLATVAGCVSSTAVFWFGNVETYPFGSVSVLFALYLASLANHIKPKPYLVVVSGVLTFAYTITNFWASIASAFAVYPPRKAFKLLAISLVIGLGLFAVQKVIFPSAGVPMDVRGEQAFIRSLSPTPVYEAIRSFVVHSAVAPTVETTQIQTGRILTFQKAGFFDRSFISTIAVICWIVMLASGVYTIARDQRTPLITAVVIFVLGQLALHVVYGEETFLYALHYFPALLILAAFSLKGKQAKLATVVFALFVLTAAVSNLQALQAAIKIAYSLPVVR